MQAREEERGLRFRKGDVISGGDEKGERRIFPHL